MKISVIMSVYNGANTLRESIDSVLKQTFDDFEFIIVNDGSVDDTARIIREYEARDNRIIIIEHDNQGLTDSLNVAIKNARGEYIARQDADDVSLPQRFYHQVRLLDKEHRIGFAGCNYALIDEKGSSFDFGCIRNNPDKIAKILAQRNMFCHGSVLFRREVIKRAGGYRAFFKYAQDYDLYLRLIEFTLPGSVNRELYLRRVLLDSISVRKNALQSAYAALARKCYQERLAKRGDRLILTLESLDKLVDHSGCQDSMIVLLELAYCIKNNDPLKSRILIQPYLFPLALGKWKFYLLWLFSYFPHVLRDIIFALKTNIRRIKVSAGICN